ncbi:MAG: glycosyltransferase [Fimbriimonadaceae bacterium]|nr:glycosyltransferase [Fimbriimonadaceae bacterium]
MKSRLAFVDHSFHQKTKSSDFFVELLERSFEVVRVWDEAWQGGAHATAAQIDALRVDAVVMWQAKLPEAEIRQIKVPITWVPMFDQSQGLAWGSGEAAQTRRQGLKVIAFCKAIAENLTKHGVEVLPVQYFIEPAATPIAEFSKPSVFLWQRAEIGFEEIKALFEEWPDVSFLVKVDPDPGTPPCVISIEDQHRYRVTVIQGFLPRDEYLELVGKCNIYVAPRSAEGIGLSFLEAMAKGMIVAAPDRPTMNEYIRHGQNGWLFNVRRAQPIKPCDLSAMSQATCKAVVEGADRWQSQATEIASFIAKRSPYPFKGVGFPTRARIFLEKVHRRIYRVLGR